MPTLKPIPDPALLENLLEFNNSNFANAALAWSAPLMTTLEVLRCKPLRVQWMLRAHRVFISFVYPRTDAR